MTKYEKLAFERGQQMRRNSDNNIKQVYFCPYNFYTQNNLYTQFNEGWNNAYSNEELLKKLEEA